MEAIDMTTERLGPLMVIDGAGWAPPIGSSGYLLVFAESVEIGEQGSSAKIAQDELLDVSIDGSSVTTGGGFIGGGFGVKGAVEGMIAASVLNALTTRTHKWVTIGLSTCDGWVVAQLDGQDVLPTKHALRRLADWVVLNQSRLATLSSPAATGEGHDLVSQLERLGALLESGILSPEEFRIAKSRLLGL